MANVYWLKGRASDVNRGIMARIDALLSLDEMKRLIIPEKSLAIKINLSELGYGHYLPPVITSTFFEKIRSTGCRPVVTDSCSLFKGSRYNGYDWTNTAIIQGFSIGETFDNQMMLAGGYTNEEGKFHAAPGERLGGVDIGSLPIDAGRSVVLSHVTAHPVLGLAGAMYNFGLGLLTGSGKLRVHSCLELAIDRPPCDDCGICLDICPTGAAAKSGGEVRLDSRICNGCLGCFIVCPRRAVKINPETVPVFQESVVEAAAAVRENLLGGVFFINFLSSVTPQSDDYPFSDAPFLPDLGILASEDPVALDWATYQMTVRSPGLPGSIAQDLDVLEKGRDKILAVTGTTPEAMLEYAEKMNLGSRRFDFLQN